MKNIITIIRMAIGWHFLYEGCIKLFSNSWSAESILNDSRSFLSGVYHWLAASSVQLAVIDFLNVWGLVLIGLALFLGMFVRWASLAGALLLVLYYFAYPPFGASLLTGDGSVYIINQLSIEAAVLIFFFCYKEKGYGLDNAIRLLEGSKYELKF
uniref:DoxX family membrane protein n=1 Tax=uncultured Draconibacterium sp. TaxID=1573823 RepID=UPI003217F15B